MKPTFLPLTPRWSRLLHHEGALHVRVDGADVVVGPGCRRCGERRRLAVADVAGVECLVAGLGDRVGCAVMVRDGDLGAGRHGQLCRGRTGSC